MKRLSHTMAALLLSACSGEAKDHGSDVTDDVALPADPAGVVIATEIPETPWITVGATGTVIVFHVDPAQGGPSGLTVMLGDGRTGVLGIDPATGHPTHWVSEGYVWTFSNVRPELGLLDVGLIAPDGTTGQIKDLAVPPVEVAAPASASMSTDDAAKFGEALGALGVGLNLTVCVGSAILTTGGAVVGTLTFPPAAVPLFETSALATSAACAGAVIALMALRPENTTAVRVNNALESVDGALAELQRPQEVLDAVAECAAERSTWECLQAAATVIELASSETVKSVLEHYIRLRDGVAVGVPYQVYCCSGPTQVKVGDPESWRATVIEGLGKLPFTYQWSFGDSQDETWLRSDAYSLAQGHTFYEAGIYAVKVKVRDAALNEVQSNATATGPLSTFFVEAIADPDPADTSQPDTAQPDTTPTDTTPADTTPTDTTPADTTPADTTPADTAPTDTTPADTTPADPIEWVVWRPTTVGCWDAPHLYVAVRSGYEAPQAYCNTPYGGVDCSQNIEKTLVQGGFADASAATAWACSQLSCYFVHNWCPPHFLMGDKWVLAQHLGCVGIPTCSF